MSNEAAQWLAVAAFFGAILAFVDEHFEPLDANDLLASSL